MSMRVKHSVIHMLFVGLLCICTLGVVAGCAGVNNEELAKQALTSELDKLKSSDSYAEEILQAMSDDELAEMESTGIDPQKFLKACLAKFDYKINSVAVEGDKATAQVSITNIDAMDALTRAITDVTAKIFSGELQVDATDKAALTQAMYDLFYQYAEEAETKTTNIEVPIDKVNGTWEVSDSAGEALMGSIFGMK